MIGSNPFGAVYQAYVKNNNNTVQQLKKYGEAVARREKSGLSGDVFGECLAEQLKKADEYRASGESCGATDSIGIILRQMDEPEAGGQVTKTVFHKGVCVQVVKDAVMGNSITIGGSANPDWIHVSTSVGTVHIDLNDIDSLMKCLDLFSPEDLNAILREITKVRQTRDALQEIENTEDALIKLEEPKEEAKED